MRGIHLALRPVINHKRRDRQSILTPHHPVSVSQAR